MLAAALTAESGSPVELKAFDTPAEAYDRLAAAPPDGTTLGLVAAEVTMLHWRGQSGVKPDALAPLALIATDPAGIHVRANDTVRSVQELAADLRARPGARKISGAGRGAIWHMAAMRWHAAANLGNPAWSAAASPRDAIADLAAGETDIVVCSIPEVRATPETRLVRTVGVMMPSRYQRYPEVPSISEAGLKLDVGFWRGVAGPAGLPAAARGQATALLKRAYQNATFQRDSQRRGFHLRWADERPFGEFMGREDAAMGTALKAAGLA
ncbi:MAG: tripartite tricarboxylate transporter substrate-binding protein [Hyphomicrobiaceae bacterium]